ncbi:ribosomal protein L2 [Methanomethylovorans hollandica DSM 15978]|jgi:large subunit ribosomal protein L2|uniref:Large ribosomal subunit protein uL2 n=1 Tax=Methanomethylovorans hollandica (strain DSM 15978 / NBRC 107637 / DMS1) TaxID=867904 RepID=L0KYK8_METHD|nr:50S ribosomal protein L2 [Methanomethylovorans hollandica]AGB50191.1 ribosomal protein L2 [Methanomethylovorans hollandica DSM 15978]
MGKRLISQNRGRGTPTYRAPSHKYKASLKHPKVNDNEMLIGTVVGLEHDPARSAPLAKVSFANGEEKMIVAPEGMAVGTIISCGTEAAVRPGNVLPLRNIPEGVPVCNVESKPNDGGQFARSSGVYATVVSHDKGKTVVQMPSGEMKWLNSKCRATVGIVAGGGRLDRPFLKAGKKYHKMKTRAAKYPRVRGVAMNVVDHPFGGGNRQHPGRPTTVSRNAPPGRKVGQIAARRTGKR